MTGTIVELIPSSISNAPLLVSFGASLCETKGSLPFSLSQLSQLQYLDLSENSISGVIPSSISNLKHLYFLSLYQNEIQGQIPNSICEISSLQSLDLHYNKLTGALPSCLEKLQHLTAFNAYGNSVEGTVYLSSLINKLNLTQLDLSSNRPTIVIDKQLNLYPNLKLKVLRLNSCTLKGSPNFICNLTGLEELDLSHTSLTGTIPSCLFKFKYLTRLDLSNNMFSGIIPLLPWNLLELDLSNNKISGEISVEMGKRLSKLYLILLAGNQLSGSIPFSIFPTETEAEYDNTNKHYLDLSNNKLSGSIPPNVWRGSSLFFLDLGTNNLTGIVPKELKFAKYLQMLLLNNNHLDGTINFVSALHNLTYLNLANNNFRGNIPTALGSLHLLTILSLRSNKLSGPIPEDIFHLHQLCILDLSLNNLSGHIPAILGLYLDGLTGKSSCEWPLFSGDSELSLLIKGIMMHIKEFHIFRSVVDLSCNTLDGNIPEALGLLKALSSLNLSHNQFSDDIPESLGKLTALESLDLSSNRLSGSIPQSLTTIDTLGVLNFSYNKLSGMIPRGTHFDTLGLDGSVFTGNDLLCGFPTEKICKDSEAYEDGQEDIKEKLLLYAIVALGFAVGFWGLFICLFMKKEKWWFPYWKFINSTSV